MSAYTEPEEMLWRHLNTLHAAVRAISWKLVHTALLLLSETEGPRASALLGSTQSQLPQVVPGCSTAKFLCLLLLSVLRCTENIYQHC